MTKNIDPETWAVALRGLMGYPMTTPERHMIIVAVGNPLDAIGVALHCKIVRELERNLLRVEFDAKLAPTGVQLAIRDRNTVTWHSGCVVYSASDTAPLEILTDDARWYVGPDRELMARPLPKGRERMAGIERGSRRWKSAVASLGRVQFDMKLILPPGTPDIIAGPTVPRHAV